MVLHTSGVREGHPDYERQISSSLWRSEAEKQQAGIRERFCGPCSVNAWQSGATVHSQAFSRASNLSRESLTLGAASKRALPFYSKYGTRLSGLTRSIADTVPSNRSP